MTDPDWRMRALRERIDALDEQIVALLNERASCALEIGEIKRTVGMAIYQPGREKDVLDHVQRVNAGPLDGDAVRRLFERIIDEARRLERVVQQSHDAGGDGAASNVEPPLADAGRAATKDEAG